MHKNKYKDDALNSEKYTYKPISQFYINKNDVFTIKDFVYKFPRVQFNVYAL